MITLDTHVIIWDALKPDKISKKARREIDRARDDGEVFMADISLWEIAVLIEKKRLIIETSYAELVRLIRAANPYSIQCITPEIADLSVSFPSSLNLDPADRLICATSVILSAPLVTIDKNLRESSVVKTIW